MKKYKKFLTFILSSSLLLTLASCNENTSSPFNEPLVNQYKVTFYGKEKDKSDKDDSNNTIIYSTYVYEHESASLPSDISLPTKEDTIYKSYIFNNWADENGNASGARDVTSNISLYPIFNETDRYYTVTYYDNDRETVLYTDSVIAGGSSTFKGTVSPSKASDALHSYVFNDTWEIEQTGTSSSLDNVITNLKCYPLFDEVARTYLVKFFDYKESQNILYRTYVTAGDYVEYPTDKLGVPTREATHYSDYEDIIWHFTVWKILNKETNEYETFNITTTKITEDINLYADFTYSTQRNDKYWLKEYVKSHQLTDESYLNIENGYVFAPLESGYYLGWSDTDKKFMLYMKRSGLTSQFVNYLLTTTDVELRLKFDYSSIESSTGTFIYTLNIQKEDSNETEPLDIKASFTTSKVEGQNILNLESSNPSVLGDTNYKTYESSIKMELNYALFNFSSYVMNFVSLVKTDTGNVPELF